MAVEFNQASTGDILHLLQRLLAGVTDFQFPSLISRLCNRINGVES